MNKQSEVPALVNWTGYLAVTLLLVLPVSVLMIRAGVWQQGLLLYALSCLGSTVLLILAITLALLPRFSAWRSTIAKRAVAALPGTLLLLAMTTGGGAPAIHDITTDVTDPPVFVMAAKQRGDDTNPLDIDPDVIDQQIEAYPDLITLRSPLSIDEAFTHALEVATELGWEIYYQNRNTGVIEAVDTTRIMNFKDDIAIRVRGDAAGALIDLRSVSRVGLSDLGANAKRIRAFNAAFQQQ